MKMATEAEAEALDLNCNQGAGPALINRLQGARKNKAMEALEIEMQVEALSAMLPAHELSYKEEKEGCRKTAWRSRAKGDKVQCK